MSGHAYLFVSVSIRIKSLTLSIDCTMLFLIVAVHLFLPLLLPSSQTSLLSLFSSIFLLRSASFWYDQIEERRLRAMAGLPSNPDHHSSSGFYNLPSFGSEKEHH